MIYDITQELFSAEIYPGDPIPKKQEILSLNKKAPDLCQLTEMRLGSHTGTHLDAPCHFIAGGKDVEQLDLNKCIGRCVVTEISKVYQADTRRWGSMGIQRILFKNQKKLSVEEAECLAAMGCQCVGVECSTIGIEEENERVHKLLLSNEIVIIEGLRMEQVPEGEYFLSALPLKMRGLDGSPIRAILYTDMN